MGPVCVEVEDNFRPETAQPQRRARSRNFGEFSFAVPFGLPIAMNVALEDDQDQTSIVSGY
jgi:hypothetical protein